MLRILIATPITAACALALLLAGGSPSRPPVAVMSGQQSGLPVVFEPNAGRAGSAVRFISHAPGHTVLLGDRDTRVVLRDGATIVTRLVGARPTAVAGSGRATGRLNIVAGADRSRWTIGAPLFQRVAQRGVYPGIDLVHHGNGGALEYDFQVAAGADPARISMAVDGASLALQPNGDLQMHSFGGTLVHQRPLAYQRIGERQVPVDASFVVRDERVRFDVGAYDRTKPLVIDPVMAYSTFFGSAALDRAQAIDAADGSAYIGGMTTAPDMPGKPATAISGSEDAYVAKLAPDGKSVSYLTYLVGNDVDEVTGVAVNSGGDAFAAGWTASTDFPSTTNVGANPSSGKDVFVVRLGPGGAPAWATEFGGGGDDEAHGITINDAGAPVVVGSTDGPPPSTASFPTAGTGADTIVNGGIDGFATMLEADGSAITMSTLIGGSGDDDARAVVTIGAFPHVAGTTNSTDFPLQNEYQASLAAAGNDMFYASFALTGARVDSTYIGGTGTDSGTGIAVGRANASAGWGYDVWVTGQTDSATVLGQTGFHGGVSDGLAVRLGTPSPTVLFVGGTDSDSITGATSDNAGNLIIGGMTGSNPLQIGATSISTLNGTDTGSNGGLDGYVAKIRGDAGYAPAWGTYLGGSDMEWVWAVATDEGSGIYAAGFTFSSDFPASADALQAQRNNWSFDGFATKWAFAPVVVTGPTGYQTTNSATFQFSSDEPGVSFHCRLAPTLGEHNCANSRTFNNLADGTYTFGVYATDTTGTRDPFVERRFTVDTTAPAEFALREPAEGAQTGTTPTFTWDPAADANGIASYRLEIDGTAQTVDVTACGSGRCQAPSATALKTGARSWRVVAIDTVGNERASATRNFIAQAPPTARFTSAPNPALVGHAVTFDGSPSADGSHTVARYEWDLDGDGSYETDGGASATASRSYATVQTLQIGLRITDSTGLTAEAHNELRVTTQTIVGQFGVSINEGAQYSRTPDVTVTANFPSAITDMLFSNDGGFFAPTRFAPAKLTTWTLDSSGPERLPKIVYIRFLTGPLTSETHTDDIILDETPPKVDSAAIAGPPKAAASAAKKRRYVLKLKASDSNSGVAGIQVTANKRTPGKLLRYKRKLTVKATARPRWVRARDRAGNLSGWRKVR